MLISRYLPTSAPSDTSVDRRILDGTNGLSESHLQLHLLPACDITTLDEPSRAVLFQHISTAWISLLGLEEGQAVRSCIHRNHAQRADLQNPCDFFTLPSAEAPAPLHPLTIAMTLPLSTTSPLLHNLYRHLVTYTTRGRADWLRLRQLSTLAMALTISTDPPTKTTPQALWTQCKKTSESFIRSGSGKEGTLEQASKFIGETLDFVEEMLRCEARSQSREKWFAGQEWTELMDAWVDISRKVGDKGLVQTVWAELMRRWAIPRPSIVHWRSWTSRLHRARTHERRTARRLIAPLPRASGLRKAKIGRWRLIGLSRKRFDFVGT